MARRQLRPTSLRLESLESRDLLSINPLNLTAAKATVPADDYLNTFAGATVLTLNSDGSGSKTGTIERANDVDMFKVVATVTGNMTISESAASGSSLDTFLYVYRSNQTLLASNDDSGTSTNSRVTIAATRGTTYYVKAAAYARGTGAYVLQVDTAGPVAVSDDYGNIIDTATAITLSSNGAGSQTGKIEKAGDVDMFKVVATTTGKMRVIQTAATGSRLDSYLSVYDDTGALKASNDDVGTGSDSYVRFDVVAGKTYYIKAGAYGNSTDAYTLQITSRAHTGNFDIDLVTSGMTLSQLLTVEDAAARWEDIIVGDIPNTSYNGQVIDDLQINMSIAYIDGPSNILGWSWVDAYRSDGTYLPIHSFIEYDSADVATMESNGSFYSVVLHEMAHSLGFGIIWNDLDLLTGTTTSNPGFTGANAVAAYNAIFGTSATFVPVEESGGSGTRLSHWNEETFRTELMTGYINSGTNPLSTITIASMKDLGYVVDMTKADTYTRPRSSTIYSAIGGSSANSSSRISVLDRPTSRLRAFDQIFALYS